MPKTEYPLLTVQEAADLLGVHENTIRRAVRRGNLPAYRMKRVIKLTREDVLALLDPIVPMDGKTPLKYQPRPGERA